MMKFVNIDYNAAAKDFDEDKSFDCYTDSNCFHRIEIYYLKYYYLALSRRAIVLS